MSFFIYLGIALLALLLTYLVHQDWHFFSGPRRRTTGTVVGHQTSTDDGSTFYSPKVRFETGNGRTIEIVDTFGSASQTPPVGAALDVVYPQHAPDRGRVPHPLARTIVYAFTLGTLSVLLSLALGWLK